MVRVGISVEGTTEERFIKSFTKCQSLVVNIISKVAGNEKCYCGGLTTRYNHNNYKDYM